MSPCGAWCFGKMATYVALVSPVHVLVLGTSRLGDRGGGSVRFF